MEELDQFYGATEFEPLEQRTAQIASMLFDTPPAAHVLLAKDGDDTVGLAAYSFLWPAAGLTHSLFLKELYVRRQRKREGVGTALVRAVCKVAEEAGCSRVEWQTETDNVDAQRFYAAVGADLHGGKVFYRLAGDAIRKVAGDSSAG
jgi:GNAT superfamily N-acetyltransferase